MRPFGLSLRLLFDLHPHPLDLRSAVRRPGGLHLRPDGKSHRQDGIVLFCASGQALWRQSAPRWGVAHSALRRGRQPVGLCVLKRSSLPQNLRQ